jgi:hypothetical protein
MKLAREMYFAILLDRSSSGPIMIGCSEGGTSIEDLAKKFPEKIIKIHVDILEGITDAQTTAMAKGLAVKGDVGAAAEQIKHLYELFVKSDCTMVEVRSHLWLAAHVCTALSFCKNQGARSNCLMHAADQRAICISVRALALNAMAPERRRMSTGEPPCGGYERSTSRSRCQAWL